MAKENLAHISRVGGDLEIHLTAYPSCTQIIGTHVPPIYVNLRTLTQVTL